MKKKIYFCHTGLSTFVKCDVDLLSEKYSVIPFHYKLSSHIFSKSWSVIYAFFHALYYVPRVDVVYSFFAGYHCFFAVLLAKIFRKKSIVVVGGFDADYVPSLNYGIFYTKGLLLWCIRKIYRWCTWICPVDESLVKSTNYYADPIGVGYKTGILNHMIINEAKIKVIPTGYDVEKFKNLKVEHSFDIISVGYVSDDQNFVRKGFDLIFEVAKVLPNLKIVIVGFTNEYLDKLNPTTPSNITLINFVPQEELTKLFSSSKIVLQLSMAEGLPNTLCEAMLCECIPIGSDVNGIPKAIGDTGFILKEKNEPMLIEYINKGRLMALSSTKPRDRIVNSFHIGQRRSSLFELVDC